MKTFHIIYREVDQDGNPIGITSKGINIEADGFISAMIRFSIRFKTEIIVGIYCLDQLHSLMISTVPISELADNLEAANISSQGGEYKKENVNI